MSSSEGGSWIQQSSARDGAITFLASLLLWGALLGGTIAFGHWLAVRAHHASAGHAAAESGSSGSGSEAAAEH